MLHERLTHRSKFANLPAKPEGCAACAQPSWRSSTIGRPALPARAVIWLIGIVPLAVGPIAAVAPGDMRRVPAAAIISARRGVVSARRGVVPVGRYAEAEIESGIRIVVAAMIAAVAPVVVPMSVSQVTA